MGLFSSKYETTVGTSVARVIDDQHLPNSIKNGALRSLIENDDQFVEYVMEEMTQSIGLKANTMYEYGRTTYGNGLPNSTLESSLSGETLVKNKIEEEVGPITIDYYHFGMLNTLHVGWVKLMQLYAYNSTTNQLTVNGQQVYLVDMVVVVREATLAEMNNGALDQWGTSPTAGNTPARVTFPTLAKHSPWETDTASTNDYLRVTYTWLDAVSKVQTGALTIPVIGFNENASYHQVKYKKQDGTYGYWLYMANAGVHQAIDKLHTPAWATGGSFFPWAYFRFAKASLASNKNSTEYKQNKKLTKYLGMDYDVIADAIDQNPDIDQVENAMLMMSIPAVTTNQSDIRYLFDFFEGLFDITGGELKPSEMAGGISGFLKHFLDSSSEDSSIVIQDKKFKMALGFRHIFKTRIPGNIGKIGTHSSSNGKELLTEVGGDGKELVTPVSYHIYKRQISDSVYEEIKVINLKMRYFVFGDYASTANEDDDILLIPIDKSITENYQVSERETLYARSLHFVFNSRVITEVKWYQQGWFRAVLFIVAVVLTVMSFGETWQLVVASLAAGGTLVAAAIIIAQALLRQILIALVLKVFVKIVGIKFAFIIVVIAAISGGYQAIEAGSINGAPWSQDLLSISSGLTKAINNDLKDDFNSLKQEYDEFSDLIKTKKEKLEAAQNELGYNNYLAPIVIFGEKPQEFYDRTVHSGNIGVMGIDAITSYVDVALTLPKLSQTIGENTV